MTTKGTRRDLLTMLGAIGGSATMFQAMQALGAVQPSDFPRARELEGRPKADTSVVILGAGMAGLVSALELSKAGYKVQLLEYNARPGGRSWSIKGGDVIEEFGSAPYTCQFKKGLYLNPGPHRIAQQHAGYLHYCRQFNITLESIAQCNTSAYVHSEKAFGGKPQRWGSVRADFQGHIAELLAKATNQHALDDAVGPEDREKLLDALRGWGALDGKFQYTKEGKAQLRHTALDTSEVIGLSEILRPVLWEELNIEPLMQPIGGMGELPYAMAKPLEPYIKYRAKVSEIHQDATGVTVTYLDRSAKDTARQVRADYCINTIPISILSKIPMNVGQPMVQAMNAIHYVSSVKNGLQFKRRFWEQDEGIYGGLSFTDLDIHQILYPSHGFGAPGSAVVVTGFVAALGRDWMPISSFEHSAETPEQRVKWGLEQGAKLHPQMLDNFENGVSIAWHRVPSHLGAIAQWNERDGFERHYNNLIAFDNRIVLAGEHASMQGGWQEGAIVSARDAISRLHQRVMAT